MRLVRVLPFLLLAACATQEAATKDDTVHAAVPVPKPPPPPEKLVIDTSRPMPPGLDDTAMDLKADPCEDFYQFACGGWMAATEIPADRPLYSRGFVSIADKNELALKGILEEAAASKLPEGTAFAKQLGEFYGSCMDEAKLEKGLPAVQKWVKQLTKSKSAKDLAKTVGTLHAAGFTPFFDVSAMQDLKVASEVVVFLDQNGLGLPDRDYYVEDDARKKTIREAYVPFVAKMFQHYGYTEKDAAAAAQTVMDLETRLAKLSQTKVERRDPNKLYNRLDRAGLEAQAKDFPWSVYFTAVGGAKLTAINVNSVPYFQELAAIAKDTKPAALKEYLTWHVIRGSLPALPKAFQDEAFAFTSKHLSGAKEDRPRWKKCVGWTDNRLGEALGREFTRRYFPEDSKGRTSAMIESLQKSFEKNLGTLAWMDEPTRAAALTKVQRMVSNNKIGYPNQWRDYGSVKTKSGDFFANWLETGRFEVKRQLAKVGQPVDRNEWYMSPPTVNAYYDGQKNEIVFPAGILQPPFFNAEATDAVNFGSMGMVVGHEITHGFDDEGRQFDADGNLKDWWSEAAGKAFVEKASCVQKQFDDAIAIDDIHVKGDLTLGENVADLGGLKLSHAAMKDWYVQKGPPKAGYRFDLSQQFFLGFAQSWCTKVRPEMARLRAATDPHAPPHLRVLEPVKNLASFKKAFKCQDTAKMVRAGANQCVVW